MYVIISSFRVDVGFRKIYGLYHPFIAPFYSNPPLHTKMETENRYLKKTIALKMIRAVLKKNLTEN